MFNSSVQIPLWTIVTKLLASEGEAKFCSDSSMDDCNRILARPGELMDFVQIPLWTIVTDWIVIMPLLEFGSDSSMDDCNCAGKARGFTVTMFRFLYGRL